jgi:hypothetical protein
MRNAIGRQFNMGLLQGKIVATGAEVQCQFPTRKYSQTPGGTPSWGPAGARRR